MNKKHLYTELIKLAKKHFYDFSFAVKKISYERKGILYSEMFFLYISSLNSQPKRIIESGRARGQSTLILSIIFPKCEIISIEHDQNSEDVKKIFIHDMLNGSPERKFLENHIQSISCSDQPIIAKHTHKLDKNKKNLDQDIYFSNLKHYGYSLLCIHNLKNRSYILLSILSRIFQFKERIQRKLNAYGKKQSL